MAAPSNARAQRGEREDAEKHAPAVAASPEVHASDVKAPVGPNAVIVRYLRREMPPPGDDSSSQGGRGTGFRDVTEPPTQRTGGNLDTEGELLAHFPATPRRRQWHAEVCRLAARA